MTLDELIGTIDIVDFLSQFVELEEKNGEWWGLSCFKTENTPSFSVRREPPVFFDYSSGIGGNVFTFVRYYFNYTAQEAVEYLRKYAGDEDEKSAPAKKTSVSSVAKRFSAPRRTVKAGVSKPLPDNYMERYEKRADKLAVWEGEGISRASLDKFQVYYDAFSDRLVYPIRSPDGRIVNVGGRTLDPEWKEKGLRKYNYFFNWGRLDTIYGFAENLESIKKKNEIVLFEGCKSVLIADTWGIGNAGAILTSHLNPEQMKLLAKLGCRVIFALDKDVDVMKDHNIEKLRRYVPVEYIFDDKGLLREKDSPVDRGIETFETLYNRRKQF